MDACMIAIHWYHITEKKVQTGHYLLSLNSNSAPSTFES